MSSVSGPSDGGYNYYQKNISDLHDELENEAKAHKKAQDEYADKLELKYKESLEDRQRDMEETINDVKRSALEANALDRENSKNEIQRMKNETYDRFGRSHGLEADGLKQQLEAKEREQKTERAKAAADLDDATNGYHAQVEKQHRAYEQQSEAEIRNTHEALSSAYDEKLAQHKEELDQNRQDSEEKIQKLLKERNDDVNFERRRATEAISDMEDMHKHQVQKLQYSNSAKSDQRERAVLAEQERNTRALNDAHKKELHETREQLQGVEDFQREWARDKGEARAQAIAEMEDDARVREQLLQESHEREIEKLKQEQDEQETYFKNTQSRNLREKDDYFTKVISEQNREHADEKKRLQDDFTRAYNESDVKRKRDLDIADKHTSEMLEHANEARADSLKNQAESYQTTIGNQRTAYEEKTDQLQRELQRRSTSADSADISPAAEQAIRERAAKHYGKQMDEERARNVRSEDSIQRSYGNRLQDTALMYQDRETQLHRQEASKEHALESSAVENIREQEYLKEAALRNMTYDQQRQEENLARNYATTLEKQRREYEQIISAIKDDAQTKINAVRQENEFNSRMTHRTFVQSQNELSRDYEKKLADQKVNYESLIDQIKDESNMALREGERKTRQALDEQGRSFEQRIAQLEVTHKERERNMAEKYEDQLDKVKRSNALLIQKKS